METSSRIDGVQESSTSSRQVEVGLPPQSPDLTDAENNSNNNSRRPSRASLPLNRRPSHPSLGDARQRSRSRHRGGVDSRHSSRPSTPIDVNKPHPPLPLHKRPSWQSDGRRSRGQDINELGNRNERDIEDDENDADEFSWGPNHPCFPHPNSHCAPDSREFETTRVIRVRKDWLAAGDLYPQFANLYPEILDPLVTDAEFRFLISNLNTRLRNAFDPQSGRAKFDAVMGLVTGYFWEDVGFTGSKRGVKAIETFLDEWNRNKKQEGVDVRVVQIRTTGYMSLDFIVPDPGIDRIDSERAESMAGGIGPAE
ncbi:Hypothetical protein R9X50_00092800 [Acrodontium crateriforme]|uniref:Ras modification protein ERF4 n=1 Tax=Acrodontium crateriforme TaxID=150365 RepID=A0AAQ3LYR3_9PEZI|nr:Hypothetical protein R9X50_00092800 [Acrodontium crateriforme]